MIKKILWIGLIIISLLLIPILVYITINANKLNNFQKTWLYSLIGYLAIFLFYIGFNNLKKRK